MQGSPDCVNGSLGYTAGPGYDMATGLGSVDVGAPGRGVGKWRCQHHHALRGFHQGGLPAIP